MSGRLTGRVALITGAASGMGRATAQLFAAEGAEVIATDLSAPAAIAGGLALAHDVRDEQAWADVVEAARARFGRIDILVNNAGILRYATVTEMSVADFDAVMAANVKSVFLGIRAVAPGMIAQGRGAIVNVSSTGALAATNATAAYAASKAAVLGYTRAAALELGPRGVRVNSLHPGSVNTPMTNAGGLPASEFDRYSAGVSLMRAAQPEELARASLYLASDDSSYCNGTALVVDGGMLAGHYYDFLPGGLPSAQAEPTP